MTLPPNDPAAGPYPPPGQPGPGPVSGPPHPAGHGMPSPVSGPPPPGHGMTPPPPFGPPAPPSGFLTPSRGMSGAVVAAGVAAFVVGVLQLVKAVQDGMFFIEFGGTDMIVHGVGMAVFSVVAGLVALIGGALVLAGKEFGRVAAVLGAGAVLLDDAFSLLAVVAGDMYFHPDMVGPGPAMLMYSGGVLASLVVVIALAGRGASDWLHHKNAKPELG